MKARQLSRRIQDRLLYNWEQKATLILDTDSGILRTTGAYDPDDASTDLTHTGIVPTSEYEVMYYRFLNNPGVELPAAGGPGTTLFYILGAVLLMLTSAGILLRRKTPPM